MYKCNQCQIEVPLNQKSIHIRRNHLSTADDLAKYYEYSKKCTKLYNDAIIKIIEINKLESEIMKLHPNQNIENKKWHIEFLELRNAFLETVKNIVSSK